MHFGIVIGPPLSVYFAQKDFAFVMAGPVVHPGRSSYHGLLSERRKSEQKSEKAEGNRSHSHGRILEQFLGSRNAARHRAKARGLHGPADCGNRYSSAARGNYRWIWA